MENLFAEIGIPVLGITIGIIGFFLKKSLNDVEELKKSEVDNKVLINRVDQLEKHLDEMKVDQYKKYAKFNTKFEKQDEFNSSIKEMLSSINAKLDMLINSK